MSNKHYPLIFIVEDNIAYSKIIEHFLNKNGFNTVFTFASGEECLKHIYLKPDIIIQDYKLQGISGLNVLQLYKKKLPTCEFLFLSGQDDINIAISTVKHGAFDYLVKNETTFERLLAQIEKIIQIQKLNRKNIFYRKLLNIFILAIILLIALLFITSNIYLL